MNEKLSEMSTIDMIKELYDRENNRKSQDTIPEVKLEVFEEIKHNRLGEDCANRDNEIKYKCDGCGKMTTLPFTPKSKANVYCRECYDLRRK